ncbi:dipeptide epimerase [Sphingomonas cavernae]|uniref:Dipeptide epimerase n=1 Tax=Sphingomonas cavernae TaxID=2320861 RepID=A0A418WSS8_9SPHN|nr:dipeptide epimerase [Sphingomonas cavernae]RJF94219.1 dipeptide epimerase [Sphingomonas cavernae]
MTGASALSLAVVVESLPLAKPFRISGHVFTRSDVVVVTLSDGVNIGRGEASGVYYLDEDAPAMVAAIERARPAIEQGVTRAALRDLLPCGGARNAVDSALWELEARRSGQPIWALAGLERPHPLLTTFTLGADDPEVMAQGALSFAEARALKLKLTGDLALDIARVRAVRAARPECWIGVDANQGFAIGDLDALVDALVAADVKLLEQPLPRGREGDLDGFTCPIPIAADESALSLADIPGLVGRFDVVNIKLDKCGGLTEGLEMAHTARRLGLQVMVGNMVGSSLAMAPAFILGQLCDIVDLDGPIFLAEDRTPAIDYSGGLAWCDEAIWGRAVEQATQA